MLPGMLCWQQKQLDHDATTQLNEKWFTLFEIILDGYKMTQHA